MDEFRLFVGIDWASQAHRVCVVTQVGEGILDKEFEHSGDGLSALADTLTSLSDGNPQVVAVSIETSRGAVVETLLERGFAVHALNPKQLDRLRDRHTVAGAKDDRRDAFVLADSLRNDRHLYRRLEIDDPLVIQLRETSREDVELSQEENRLANRLREQLHRYFPALLKLSPAADEVWLWQLLELAPTPDAARRLRRPKLDELLRRARIRRISGAELREVLQSPSVQVAPGTTEACSDHVLRLVPRLKLVAAQRASVTSKLDALLEQLTEEVPGQKSEHRDAAILLSLPGVGRVVCATMLAEASDALRARDYAALRALGGAAPVTKQSGRSRRVQMRYGCSWRLRHALYHWARVASQNDPAARKRYAAARARGQTHGRALRGIADWLLRIATSMLRSGTLYDPARLAGMPA